MPHEGHNNGPIRFGVFEADLAGRTLRKAGVRVRLQEKPFRVLAMLLAKPGEVVTREELKAELWPNEEYGEFDLGLNTAVKKVRAALGDSATTPKWIETIPKVGYQFLGQIDGAGRPESTEPRPKRTPYVVAGAVAIIVAALAFFGWRTPNVPAPELRLSERPLTYGPDVEDHPTFSPDGTRVAYSDQDDIYITLTEPGAGAPTTVTNDSHSDVQPAWSPDGAKIVFARDTGRRTLAAADFQLVLASPVEASTVQVLGEFQGRGLQLRPAWTPDGEYIGFSCATDTSDPIKRICIYEMETGESWALTGPSGTGGDEQVVFSPDSHWMAYQG